MFNGLSVTTLFSSRRTKIEAIFVITPSELFIILKIAGVCISNTASAIISPLDKMERRPFSTFNSISIKLSEFLYIENFSRLIEIFFASAKSGKLISISVSKDISSKSISIYRYEKLKSVLRN